MLLLAVPIPFARYPVGSMHTFASRRELRGVSQTNHLAAVGQIYVRKQLERAFHQPVHYSVRLQNMNIHGYGDTTMHLIQNSKALSSIVVASSGNIRPSTKLQRPPQKGDWFAASVHKRICYRHTSLSPDFRSAFSAFDEWALGLSRHGCLSTEADYLLKTENLH